MTRRFVPSALALGAAPLLALGQATAFRGTHVGFDTLGGQAGQQLLLKTGYGTSGAPESEQWAFRFQFAEMGGQLQTRTQRHADNPNAPFDIASYNLFYGAPATMVVAEGGGPSPVAGWYAQSSIATNPVTDRQTFNPTGADAFVAAGRLTGGSFAYEIMSVTPLGSSPAASFALGLMETTGITTDSQRRLMTMELGFDAMGMYDVGQAGGGTLTNRTAHVGNGNHFHGWGFFISQQGSYEISMRVYDVTGKYATSEAFTFQVTSVPAPAGMAVIALGGLLAARRRRI